MNKPTGKRRIAIIHDSLQYFGGAERVLVALHRMYPQADVYTSVIDWDNLGPYKSAVRVMRPRTSFVQRFSVLVKRPYLFRYILPFVWARVDLTGYDLVISCSYSQMAHLVRIPKGVKHIIYSFAPPRHLYGYETDFPWEKNPFLHAVVPWLNRMLIFFDKRAVRRADRIISESKEVAKRFLKFYGVPSGVIYPPVSITGTARKKSLYPTPYYLSVARLSRRKHVDTIVKACNSIGARLVVVGVGPEESYLRSIAGPGIVFVGNAQKSLPTLYAHATALICAGTDEDFGLVAVEAMSFGTPVIALDEGGYRETVTAETGELINSLSAPRLAAVLHNFPGRRLSPSVTRRVLERFGEKSFRKAMRKEIGKVLGA